jgi:hypothetical protein
LMKVMSYLLIMSVLDEDYVLSLTMSVLDEGYVLSFNHERT